VRRWGWSRPASALGDPLAAWSRGWPCLRTGLGGGNGQLIPAGVGATWAGDEPASARPILEARARRWPVCAGLGVARLLGAALPEAGRLVAGLFRCSPPCSGAPGAGARRGIPRAIGHGPGQRAGAGAKQRLAGVLFGEPLAAVAGRTLAGRAWRGRPPAGGQPSRWATHLLGTRILPPLAGGCADPGRDVGRRPYRIEACSPLGASAAPCNSWLGLGIRQISLTADESRRIQRARPSIASSSSRWLRDAPPTLASRWVGRLPVGHAQANGAACRWAAGPP